MNDLDASPTHRGEDAEPDGRNREPSRSMRYGHANVNSSERLVELEMENSRLHRLVAELLLKNEQLRKSA